jgi:ribose transport system substrate-binding protein
VDRDTWRNARAAFIGTDSFAAGRELGRCARILRPDGGTYVTFAGRRSAQNAVERGKGFEKGAGDKFKFAGFLADGSSWSKARENVRSAIKDHPDASVLVGLWSLNGPNIADVVKELERKKDFTVLTFDTDPPTTDLMEEGMIDASVVQNGHQMGFEAVRLMKAFVEKDDAAIKKMMPKFGEKEGDIYHIDVKVVVPDKDSPVKVGLFDKSTELLRLSDFQQWVKKRNEGE